MIIGTVITIIIAAFVLLPGLKSFSQMVIGSMNSWWSATVAKMIFPSV